MSVVFRKPYYAWSQYAAGEDKNPQCSSVEFWRWFDDQLTREERARINYALNGPQMTGTCNAIIGERYEAWEQAKRGTNAS